MDAVPVFFWLVLLLGVGAIELLLIFMLYWTDDAELPEGEGPAGQD